MLIPITSPADIALVKSSLDRGMSSLPEVVDLPLAPKWKKITLSYSASVLMAADSSNMENRTRLIVTNHGPSQIRLNGSSSDAAIFEKGYPVEPGQTVVFNASSSVSVYGRSMGYKTSVEVTEA